MDAPLIILKPTGSYAFTRVLSLLILAILFLLLAVFSNLIFLCFCSF